MAPLTRRSLTGRRWQLQDADADVDSASSPQLPGLPPVAARCLRRRFRQASPQDFLQPRLQHLHDPLRMLGMAAAVDRIRHAVDRGERVRIVTDYDVDGTTSSLILQNTLRLLGAGEAVSYHIPDRFDEGYGFSEQAAAKAARDGIGLIVTADIGVRDHAAVSAARSAGVDVIVCDHHLPDGGTVPEDAFAVLCPPQPGCSYPNEALAACGVSLKLAQALLADHPKLEPILRSMLKIAAIGTVADVVDLGTLENRAIVALGLEELRRGRHSPGLMALLEVAGINGGHRIDAFDLGFRIGPRINAAGRLDKATAVVELFDERDPDRARARALDLNQLNLQRQELQRRLEKQVVDGLHKEPPPFVVAWGPEPEGWHRGVVGIVAARVRDRVHRPTAIVSVQGELAVGSVRSVHAIHALRALDSVRDILVRYGGHPVAAGFTVRAEDLPRLQERLSQFVAESTGTEDLVPSLDLDASCEPRALDRTLARAIEQLGPFGKGNSEPLLHVTGVTPENLRPLGQGNKHIRFDIGRGVDAVWWNGERFARSLQGRLSIAGKLGFNRWNGREMVRLTIEDAMDEE